MAARRLWGDAVFDGGSGRGGFAVALRLGGRGGGAAVARRLQLLVAVGQEGNRRADRVGLPGLADNLGEGPALEGLNLDVDLAGLNLG